MSYMTKWHRDYAAESIKSMELSRWAADADVQWARYAVECAQVAELAATVGRDIGSDTIVGIAQTVIDTIVDVARGGTPRTRSRRKITDAQRHTLAVALLEKFGSARGIAAAVWQLTDEEINNADA